MTLGATLFYFATLLFYLFAYRIEGQVKQEGLEGSEEHLARRRSQSAPIMQQLRALVDQNLESAPPKSPIGKASPHQERDPDQRAPDESGEVEGLRGQVITSVT